MYGIVQNGAIIAKLVAPLSLYSNEPVFAGDSLSLQVHVTTRPAQRWELETNLEPLSFNANELFVMFVTRGNHTPFEITMPQNFGVQKARTSSSAAIATGAAGATSVVISGNNGLIPAGSMVRFTSHSKIYMTTASRDGDGAVGIYPALRRSILGEMKYREDVIGRMLLDTSMIRGMVYTDGILMDNGNLKFKEDTR